MTMFKVNYYFDGKGVVIIKAKNEQDARDKFNEGIFNNSQDIDKSENYCVDEVEELIK